MFNRTGVVQCCGKSSAGKVPVLSDLEEEQDVFSLWLRNILAGFVHCRRAFPKSLKIVPHVRHGTIRCYRTLKPAAGALPRMFLSAGHLGGTCFL